MATAWFDEDYYLSAKLAQLQELDPETYGDWDEEDVRAVIEDDAGMSLEEHFILHGAAEGVSPSEDFDDLYYEAKLLQLQDVDPATYGDWTVEDVQDIFEDAGLTPLQHYVQHGMAEDVLGYLDDDDDDDDDDDRPVEVQKLTVAHDDLTGDNDHDTTFVANIQQNAMGSEANTLGSGDELDGGAGNNTLNAQLIAGINVGSGLRPINPITKNVQNINLNAQITEWNRPDDWWEWEDEGFYYAVDPVYVNAREMVDVEFLSSHYSDADLIIQNMTSVGVGNTANMTFGMIHTGNRDTHWKEADFKVLFDQDYLLPGQDIEGGFFYDVMNQQSYDEAPRGSDAVKDFPLNAITFTLDTGAPRVELLISQEDMIGITTHVQLVALLNQKLAEVDAERADVDLSGFTFQVNGTFTDPDGRRSDRIELINTSGDKIINGTIRLDEDSGAGNLYWNHGELEESEYRNPVSTNVHLEKVGNAGDGGELVIGSMNKGYGDYNEFGEVNSNSNTIPGFDEFNITVFGSNNESSSLSGIHSTNNTLRKVTVETDADQEDSYADLIIGNDNTGWEALKDVQVFDASGLKGDLTLEADITYETIDKYLNSDDTILDNDSFIANDDGFVNFAYKGGSGDDIIDFWISGRVITESYGAKYQTTTIGNDDLVLFRPLTERKFDMDVFGNDGDDWLGAYISTGPAIVDRNDYDGSNLDSFLAGGHVTVPDLIGSSWSGISYSGGAGDDVIWLTHDTVYINQYEERVTEGWSFSVVFDQPVEHMSNGADTIINFTAGEQTFTKEMQILDTDGMVLHQGEELNLVIDGVTFTYTHLVASTLNDDDIADLSGNLFKNAEGDTLTAVYPDLKADSDGGTSILFVFDEKYEDIDPITSSITKLNLSHRVSYDTQAVIEGPEADTIQQGGYAENGNDFLDFAAYNTGDQFKGVQWINHNNDGTVDTAGISGSIGIVNGHEWIRLTESVHNDGFYDIEHVTYDDTKVNNEVAILIGTVEFEEQMDFHATNFIF